MKENNVLFLEDIFLDEESTTKLLTKLNYSTTGTKRICLHENEMSSLHVMLIEISENTFYPPHSHVDGDEYFILINGEIDILIWLNGKECEPIKYSFNHMNSFNNIIRIPKNIIHMTIPKLNSRYLEIKPGPFNKSNLILHDIKDFSKYFN